jgi:hypothetical protein
MAHLYLARGAVPAAESRPQDDAEELDVELIEPASFLQRAMQGDIALLPSVAAIALALGAH